MKNNSFLLSILIVLISVVGCTGQKNEETNPEPTAQLNKNPEPHRYGGWYCPDNFGFVPVDISRLDEVPAVSDRLPTEEELRNNMSLINVDTEKYPDAHALEMDLPRVATIYSESMGLDEIIIVIQAIVVQEDTVVGYRFANGGNGSAWLRDVQFLSDQEVASYGSQPFVYQRATLNATTDEIWKALTQTDYFSLLGEEFDQEKFFSTEWNPESQAHLRRETEDEIATGYVGMVFGNYYLHIDYARNGVHYSEKMLLLADHEKQTTDLIFASGPYPANIAEEESAWSKWFEQVVKESQGG